MTNKTYKLHTDPGHGWLAVSIKELHELGISDKITPYSYTKGRMAYLEEDLDMATFFDAYRNKYGYDPKHVESYRERTFVRSCEPYATDYTVTVKVPKTVKVKSIAKAVDTELTAKEAAQIRAEFNAKVKAAYEAN